MKTEIAKLVLVITRLLAGKSEFCGVTDLVRKED
jgi:hypothetical protein